MIAVADEGRAIAGQGSLDGPSQTLPALYKMPAADFHDITSGSNGRNNGMSPGTGYDLVTGLGSPVGNLLIPQLAGPSVVMAATASPSSVNAPPPIFPCSAPTAGTIGPDLYLGRHDAAQRGPGADLQRQRQQRGEEHHGHLQRGGDLRLHGDDHRRRRPDRHQQRERDGEPDA